ncbi:hypothetical protein AAG570_000370 [Ranatra chinensis]|uniref:EGF-like domain-containing protein n=1 Tax=Ranatra chinensis TaxID=642074 RepID=A0ABD0ZI19_9HEMI
MSVSVGKCADLCTFVCFVFGVGAERECRSDAECSDDKRCLAGRCLDACSIEEACGTNAICIATAHRAHCSCPRCHRGDPKTSCTPDPSCATLLPRPVDESHGKDEQKPSDKDQEQHRLPCTTDSDCPVSLACNSTSSPSLCADPCSVGAETPDCGRDKQCQVRDHRPICVCKYGFSLNHRGELGCAPEGAARCLNDAQCPTHLACKGGRCLNPCSENLCSENRTCSVVDHLPVCLCTRDCSPSITICLRDNGCPVNRACRNYLCIDPCQNTTCPSDAPCTVEDHKAICKFCPRGFITDPQYGCIKVVGCVDDDECPSTNACIDQRCQDPCAIQFSLCQGPNEQCQVENHKPTCTEKSEIVPGCEHCPPGVPCDPITGACIKGPPGMAKRPQPCVRDGDCLETEACYNGMCEDLCSLSTICAPTAKCHVVKHRPVCTCPLGHQGNPAIKCFLPRPSVTCVTNEDCDPTEACVGNKCQHPCDLYNPCAKNAVCVNTNHGCDCTCAEGYHGNGFVGCVPVMSQKSVCQYNEDCPPDKLCDRLNRVCINPCQEDSCGDNAICTPADHGVDCTCPPGSSGNPYIECSAVSGCHSDNECSSNEACIHGICGNPCNCGPNAICDVINHKPVCKCLTGYGGNANIGCTGPLNPCDPNPCGLNALCEIDVGGPICYCPKGMTGNPFKNCIPEGDECSPNPCGPHSGCRVVGGLPICFCLPEYEGSPPQHPCSLPRHPCSPSPCGPNTQCSVLDNGFAKCTCLPGYLESPNTIRGCVSRKNPCKPSPCGHQALCDPDRNPACYCPHPLTGNPYRNCLDPVKSLCKPGPCGLSADCYVVGNTEQCYCREGYQGDGYSVCSREPGSPCKPSPCGPLAVCSETPDGRPMCSCPEGMSGDPTGHGGCAGPQCITDDDCPLEEACMGHRCRDPCQGACGFGANCRVLKHHPVCTCNPRLSGNPLVRCSPIQDESKNPCALNPCGLNTQCQVTTGGRPVCSCLPGMLGNPQKGCRPECTLNTDCPSDSACVGGHCINPCSSKNICGLGAICTCRDHTPFCSCPPGYFGDPIVQCVARPIVSDNTTCSPSPCTGHTVCTSGVLPGMVVCDPCGSGTNVWDPRCRPECLADSDCSFSTACLGYRCMDPCPGSCGVNAICRVVKHQPVCSCPPGLIGNPFNHCIPPPPTVGDKKDSCERIRCGANARCREYRGQVVCVCPPGLFGDPYLACRPECVTNSDCSRATSCINNRCVDPCPGACGISALCTPINHVPVCHCPEHHTGDPFVSCYPYDPVIGQPGNPCDPSPCGPYSRCLVGPRGQAACSCLPGYRGVPPICRPECLGSSECLPSQACLNNKCTDPCPGTCGLNARCHVVNHNPICSCPVGHIGDPFVQCTLSPDETGKTPGGSNPCEPTPCGPHSVCSTRRGRPVCSCEANYIGSPPFCRPECTMSQECPHDRACMREKCRDPCINTCGPNAKCTVVNHTPFCTCLPGFKGDAFIQCSKIPPTALPEIPKNPCEFSPCGENAQCTNHGGITRCSCIPPYIGDPYGSGCRPECLMSADCPPNMACMASHCRDPCPGVCGINADCSVVNHVAVCTCFPGYTGDPFQACREPLPTQPLNPCDPNHCGPNSVCRVRGNTAVCSCGAGYIGSPPSCRPECVSSSECTKDKACINQKCTDPCPGTCGLHARCHVINHNPICSCPETMVGDPFVRCVQEAPKETSLPLNPCMPSPCGGNSECRVFDHRPVCSCLSGMLGAPPNCRPECLIHADCPTRLACIQSKCKDPCTGSCGFNAQCNVINHQPVCACLPGYEGDPFSGCNPVPVPRPISERDPCTRFTCAANAVCESRNGAVSCTCMAGYGGDPYTMGCRPECVLNSDCSYDRSCQNNKCVDPCRSTCGTGAECTVAHHAPFCTCPAGYAGNPLIACRKVVHEPIVPEDKHPCQPSPCGPYSLCREANGYAACSCLAGYIGIPPACRPQCLVSSECSLDTACIAQKCLDPCPGTCAPNAQCRVVNHNAICSCSSGYTGDPFVRCIPQQKPQEPVVTPSKDPCMPSICGPNSVCRAVGNTPVCSCAPEYLGRPPNCRPECTINAECQSHLACLNERCRSPCPASCGVHAICSVKQHSPICQCSPQFTGDPYVACSPLPEQPEAPRKPCSPSPCGPNAVCKERNGAGSCTCLPEYTGDPYTGCRPECVLNADCPKGKACSNNKCKDPCPGMCGINAECRVVNHAPSCSCLPGYTGNPMISCHKPPPQKKIPLLVLPVRPTDPCRPSPCGPYSLCRPINGHAVCSCQPNYVGAPPACRPECMVSADCPQDKACINQKCADPCPGTCGFNARCQVVNHNPICSCTAGYSGDPFVRCLKEEKHPSPVVPSRNPCVPSPCGPNSQCRAVGSTPACSCSPNYVGRPPNCRPECTINAECPGNLACQNERCQDPCPGSCGPFATCQVVKHAPLCSCQPGYTGDPFTSCSIIQEVTPTEGPRMPCHPSPCGANAICKERNGAGSCTCLPEYFGDPYSGCRPECVVNSDCDRRKACVNNKCKDPCPGTCGINAECRVINHAPSCSCLPGYTGDPITACRKPPAKQLPKDPCRPSPCGPFSNCRSVDNHAVCSCQPNYIGAPPACRPECMVSTDCTQDRACINQKCADPCPGTCGLNARCQVVNHNPICSCTPGYTGDPFVRCLKEQKQPPVMPSGNPCVPSPCGPNSQCRVVGNTPACSCSPNYVGKPPNCRPECTINAECPGNLACQNERCRDPCPGSCGPQAICRVIKHAPQCTCQPGYTGDPFASCSIIQEVTPTEGPRMPCHPSPCGANAVCKERNGAGSCTCLPEYFGDPYTGCRPECVVNTDCDKSKACVNNKCKDPCPGTCGVNAVCKVLNHAPSCSCLPGYTGDPITSCRLIPAIPVEPEKPKDPCQPSPCGPYSLCRPINGHAVCSCQPNYIGAPPSCRPECIVSADCPQDKACLNQKCADPCPGTCGLNARCQVVNHNPICSCTAGFTGDPFIRCLKSLLEHPEVVPSGNPCVPSPCGPNSQCRAVGNTPACSCSPNYIGRPPNCRPECTINAECSGNLACQNERCRDPCPGSCGPHATCRVFKHAPQCSCQLGYTGDPFAGCSVIQEVTPTEGPRMPCNPSPCGANAVCKERNGAGSCTCLPEYFGDPYTGCRPECVINSDCDRSKACINNKCKDPCPGTCGINAECRVANHAPSCTCLQGYSGNPLRSCLLIEAFETPKDPCAPSPCGQNSICRVTNGHAVCSCQPNFIGSPPSCRPECVVSSECAQDKACLNQKCADPCPGTCGLNARCQVLNHNPICSCSPGYTGDPFLKCQKQQTPAPPTNPCSPSPCGPYSQCRTVGSTPACSCMPNYIGRPPNCRPECVLHAECSGNLACRNERCIDPCPGSCGVHAECRVVNHNPVCTCPQGFVGDASVACHPIPTTKRTPIHKDPCFPSPCGLNADCQPRNGLASCSCLPGFEGDPYSGCKRECESNNDCAPKLACIGYKCADPCPGTCGSGAECTIANHIPVCSCPAGFTGDPFFSCHPTPPTPPPRPEDPCVPSPCGPNSQCRAVNHQAVCSCMPNYMGHPPTCRPECVVSSECSLDKACINQKCSDPCPNTCGLHAQCTTKNHNPICACPQGYTGDPFSHCQLIPATPVPAPTEAPPSCHPSPCGPNSHCQMTNNGPSCSCLPDFVGAPPRCRPECILSAECSSQQACIKQRCRDPCPGSCGLSAECHVLNHIPVCTCIAGHTGDPFTQCSPIPITPPTPTQASDPCNPSPCGPNALCREGGVCECLPEYSGNPYEACRPECVLNTECPRDKACLRNKCRDPCPGTCGQGAQCDVINHIPACSCPQTYTGDPFTLCRPLPPAPLQPVNPCDPSPCGPNSQCQTRGGGQPVCSCLVGYVGLPPSCRPECLVSAECSQTQACVNKKCQDACRGSCGLNARCLVINHSPICSCPQGNTGDPFRSCYPIPPPPPRDHEAEPQDPCMRSPCGPNSQCQATSQGKPACSCLPSYIGTPPNCRPECTINPDCPTSQACLNSKCVDPCPGSCGINAQCSVISHGVSCTCSQGYTGNPFVECTPIKYEISNPCEPSPCGANAVCKQRNGAGSCSCIEDYSGNPYEGCRPECVLSSDCPTDKACFKNKCQDPCPGVCGANALCQVINHIPTCTCHEGYVGDPFQLCTPAPPPIERAVIDPCSPSPCGPNSHCRSQSGTGQAICSCAPDYFGSPPNCRPECVVNSECPQNRACHKNKCTDPCPNTCGLNARCQVINHNPICSCPPAFTGDPFSRCYPLPPPSPQPPRDEHPLNPCQPSPCGPNSECRIAGGGQASCSCQADYSGAPPNCRPECVVNTDCAPTQACIKRKCRDPCPGSCGHNAACTVHNHVPTCTCLQGYTGDPFTLCTQIIEVPHPPPRTDPCDPSPCGANAQCTGNGVCTCFADYTGDPYSGGCRPECTLNSDCPRNKACINQKCIDPCPGTCGLNAHCDVINHIPTCTCPPPTTGDPFVACKQPKPQARDPCGNSPCGPNSVCRVHDGHAVCSCQDGMVGAPPQCRPECLVSSECPLTQACLRHKCSDPCPGTCGINARCQVVNHNPICSCSQGHTGDPFRHCYPAPPSPASVPLNPCQPSPCGPNSVCQQTSKGAACSCQPDYLGTPPNCRPQCTINPECASNQACIRLKCADPCAGGSCGAHALCTVINHTPVCSCPPSYTGDPFTGCQPTPQGRT